MSFLNRVLLTPLFCLLAFGLAAEKSDSKKEEAFPKEISFEHAGKEFKLQETGASSRKKFFVKVYAIAHYLQEGAAQKGGDPFKLILEDGPAKQLTMKWVREVPLAKIKETYHESFKNTLTPSQYQSIEKEIETYLSFFNQDAKKGDEYALRWLSGGYIEVLINGKSVGNLTNVDFAKALWNLWLGDRSVVDRRQLVSLMK